MKRLAAPIRALLAVGLFTMLILFIGGGTASAATVPIGQAGSSMDACGTQIVDRGAKANGDVTVASTDQAADSNLLTINRWGGVADNFHTRLDAAPFSDLVPALQRNVLTNTMIQTGNSMWQGSTAMTAFATRFCLMDTLGYTADHLSAKFGNAVLKGGLVTVMVVGGVVLLIWRARNTGSSPWKGVGRMVGILSLLGVMVTAAGYTGQSADKQHTSFAMGSPGFFGSTINNVIATLSSLPSNVASSQGSQFEASGLGHGNDNLSCANATKALRDAYKTQYGPGMSQLAASIPLTMSQMWENTGLASWAQAQFGSANPYGPLVYCHVLEDNLNTPRHNGNAGVADAVTPELQTQLGLLLSTSGSVPDGLNGDSVAWDYGANGTTVDESIVGWAACRWDGSAKKWAVDSVWATVASGGDSGGGSSVGSVGGKLTDKNCKKWWETNTSKIDLKDENMNYEDNPGYIRSATSKVDQTIDQTPVGNFLLNWHGNDNGTAFTLAAVYLIAAFMMMIIFGGISLGIIIAKVAMIVLIALVAIALLMSLWPGSGGSRLTSYVKFYLGTALFTFGISVIFSLITMITGFLSDAGVGQFGAGSLMATLWTGFSPIAAVVVLNMLFKHGLKMPSPLKPGAALAYGAAIGGIGMAAGAGVESLFNKAKNKGRNGVRAGGNTVKNSLRRGPTPIAPGSGGSQTMQPKNAPAPVGGSPVVAAAGATGPGVGAAASGPAAGTAAAAAVDSSTGAPTTGAGATGPSVGAAAAGTAAAAATTIDSSTGAPTIGAGATGPSVGAAAAGTAAAAATAPDDSAGALVPTGAAGLGVVGGGVPEPAGDTAVLPATGAPDPSADSAVIPAAATGSKDETLPLPIPVPLPIKPLSPTAQRAADINDKRLARKFNRTGGAVVVTGRAAGWHRRANTKLMNWSNRSAPPAGNFARMAAAGAAMAGVAGVRGAAGMIDNAQQRAVRRTRAGLNNADLFNRGKDRAKLAMATMRAKPLRTAAMVGAAAVVAANPAMLLGVGAIAARKGYNRARPKDHNGQRQSALAARRRNAPLRRNARDQARLDTWSAHQNSVAPTLPNPGTGNSAPDRIDTGSSYSGAGQPVISPFDDGTAVANSSQAETMPSDPAGATNDRNYFDAAGRPPLFGDDDKRVIFDEETHQALPHARQDFEIEQSWLADQATTAGSSAPTDYDVARSMRSTDNGRGHAINTGAVVPPASPRRPAVAPAEPSAAPAPVGDRRHSTPEAAPTAAPAAPAAPLPPPVPLPPAVPGRPATQGRPAAIANQRPIQRRPAGNHSSVRPNPTAAARASRPAAPVYSSARAVRPPAPVAAPSLRRPAPTVASPTGAANNGAANTRATAAPTPPVVAAPAPRRAAPAASAPVASDSRPANTSRPVAPAQPAPAVRRSAPTAAPSSGATDSRSVSTSRRAAAPAQPVVAAPAPRRAAPAPAPVASDSRPANTSRPAVPAQPAPAAAPAVQRPVPAAAPSSGATDTQPTNTSRHSAAPPQPVLAGPARRPAPAAPAPADSRPSAPPIQPAPAAAPPAARQPAPQPSPRTQPAASASTRAPTFASRAATAGRRPAPLLQPSDPASTPAPDVPRATPSIGDPRRGRTSRD